MSDTPASILVASCLGVLTGIALRLLFLVPVALAVAPAVKTFLPTWAIVVSAVYLALALTPMSKKETK